MQIPVVRPTAPLLPWTPDRRLAIGAAPGAGDVNGPVAEARSAADAPPGVQSTMDVPLYGWPQLIAIGAAPAARGGSCFAGEGHLAADAPLAAALLPGPITDKQMAVLAIIIVGIFVMLRRQLFASRRQPPPQRPAAPRATARLNELEESLEVRLHDSFREMNGRLDVKIHTLHKLIEDADARILELQRLSLRTPPPSEPAGEPATPKPKDDEPLIIEMDRRRSTGKPAPEEVYRLADEGLGSREIAGRLGRPQDEIDLILAVRPLKEQ